jgi:hypothetical protein
MKSFLRMKWKIAMKMKKRKLIINWKQRVNITRMKKVLSMPGIQVIGKLWERVF